MHDRRPRVIFLVDKPNWAFDRCALEITTRISDQFDTAIRYVHQSPVLDPADWDLIYVFFWGERWHRQFGFETSRVIKEVSSHRFSDETLYGRMQAAEMVPAYCHDAGTLVATSDRLSRLLKPHHPHVFDYRLGVSPEFTPPAVKSGSLRFGWAGNPNDPAKRFAELIEPSVKGLAELVCASDIPLARMPDFYRSIDVLLVGSINEGTPLPLIEGMACGVFPISTDVGVASELITQGENGFIAGADISAFRSHISWCLAHAEQVRAGGINAANLIMAERTWDRSADRIRAILLDAYHRAGPNTSAAASRSPRRSELMTKLGRAHSKLRVAMLECTNKLPADKLAPLLVIGPTRHDLIILERRGYRRMIAISPQATINDLAYHCERVIPTGSPIDLNAFPHIVAFDAAMAARLSVSRN